MNGWSAPPAPGQLHLFLVNFLSMFGDKWPYERVLEVAERAISITEASSRDMFAFMEELRRLHSANGGADLRRWRDRLLRLRGWRPQLLDSVLDRGRGLVFCSFHIGDFHSLAFDLSLLGYQGSFPGRWTDRFLAYKVEDYVEHGGIRRIHMKHGGIAAQLAQSLRSGGLAVVLLDGDPQAVDTDSPLCTEVNFHGLRLRVNNGVLRLAATLGAPILPVLAPRLSGDEPGTLTFEPVIDPGGRLRGKQQDEFAHEAVRQLYRYLEAAVEAYPEQWEDVYLLHVWRAITRDDGHDFGLTRAVIERSIQLHLESGGAVRQNRCRAVAFRVLRDGTKAWVDAKTARVFKPSPWTGDLLAILGDDDGLSWREICARWPARSTQRRLLVVLAELTERGLVELD